MELSSSNIKKFLIFSQKKAFLIFRKQKSRKSSLYFWKRNFLIFLETETLNFLYFRKYVSELKKPKKKKKKKPLRKKFLCFEKCNFVVSKNLIKLF